MKGTERKGEQKFTFSSVIAFPTIFVFTLEIILNLACSTLEKKVVYVNTTE